MKKQFIVLSAIVALILGFIPGCSPKYALGSKDQPIVVLYENDVHCYVDGYAKIAAMKRETLNKTPYVSVVSSGDYVQGGTLGAASKGEYIVEIINAVGYETLTLGNHEFDYGVQRLGELSGLLNTDIVCCNLIDLRTGNLMYKPYKMVTYGKTKVAYIGVATPYSFISARPVYFQDENGKMLYSLCAENFYENIQKTVDRARGEGAKYVIALTHLGVDAFDEINSENMIPNVSGIDVVLDAHSHSVIPGKYIRDAKGKEVLLTSTGSYFENIGKLTISPKGKFTSELVPVSKYMLADTGVQAIIEDVKARYAEEGNKVIGKSLVTMVTDDEDGPRAVRFKEMPLGDFCTDAIKNYMNTDICLMGGGSLRAPLMEGALTYNDIFKLFPFGNTIATGTMTGRQIVDALEFSVYVLPVEFGGFLQVSGLKFEVDCQTDSPCSVDVNKIFSGFISDKRRVRNVQFEKAPGVFEPIDLDRKYTVSGTNFLLQEHGDGYAVLDGTTFTDTGVCDRDILLAYIQEVLGGVIPATYDKPAGRITLNY